MTITSERIDKATVALSVCGRLDTANASLLERKIKQKGADISVLILDFAGLEYISSMGLRVLLLAKKESTKEGWTLRIKNISDSVRQVFEMTGFLNLMVQEEKFVIIRKEEDGAVVLSFIGQMHSENIGTVSKALAEIKTAHAQSMEQVTVYLDMEKLTYITPGAIGLLGSIIVRTAFPGRKLLPRNLSVDLEAAMNEHGIL